MIVEAGGRREIGILGSLLGGVMLDKAPTRAGSTSEFDSKALLPWWETALDAGSWCNGHCSRNLGWVLAPSSLLRWQISL